MASIPDIRKSLRMKRVDSHIEQLELELATARSERASLFKSQLLQCPHCQKKHKVGDLHLITGMRYHKYYAAYEDSSWDPDRTYYIVCPSCVELMSVNEAWVVHFKDYFAECKDGSLQIRKTNYDSDRKDRTKKVSVMCSSRDYVYGYDEVLVPYDAVAKAVDGRIDRFRMCR